MNPAQTPKAGESRRQFIKKTAGIAATAAATGLFKTPVYGQTQAPSANVAGANSRLVVAVIGTGKQGRNAHVRRLKAHESENNIAIGAVCDLYQKHLDEARSAAGLDEANAYREHERVLERKDIDAIVVATVDNWHAPISIEAMEAGKHVYCEKPMSRYLGEAFEVYDAVKKTGKVYQEGTQGCADPMFHKAAEWIREGKLGPLVWGQSSFCRNNPNNSEWTYPIDPDANESNLDWYRWLGRAKRIPFNPYHYFSWHKFYAYNSGIIGNLLPHNFSRLILATGNPEFPNRVTATGTRAISTDREITDTTHVLAEFPSGLTLLILGSTVNEQGLSDVLRGRQGTLHFAPTQNRVEFKPERIFAEKIDDDEFSSPLPVRSVPRLHKDWFDCIRNGGTPIANVDLGIRSNTVLAMAEMSERLGLTLFFDEKTRQVKTGDGRVVPPISYETVVQSTPTPMPV